MFGIPKYGYGTALISSNDELNVDNAFLPIPSNTFAPMLFGLQKIKYIDHKDEVSGIVKKIPILRVNVTIDHRYMDGSKAAQLAHFVKFLILLYSGTKL